MTEPAEAAEDLERQAGWCVKLGSPLTAALLKGLAADISANGPTARLVADFDEDPLASALALRVAGGFHAYALGNPQAPLAQFYASAGGSYDPDTDAPGLVATALELLADDPTPIAAWLASPPQTNEVGRAAVLLCGFLELARLTGLPLDLREIGASAGLNLGLDRFHYMLGEAAWGDENAAVRLKPKWRGGSPPVDAPLAIRSRAGCDIAPVDLSDEVAVRRLESYVWSDQEERFQRLRAAIANARDMGITVTRESANQWVEREFAAPRPGGVTVLYHSVMWQYMPAAVTSRIEAALDAAGARATDDAPVARVEMEPAKHDAEAPMELRVTLWPGGETRKLARVHPHGTVIGWEG